MNCGNSSYGSASRRKGGSRGLLGRCLQLRPVVACCSAAVGLLIGAWVVLSAQHLQTQMHLRMRFNREWIASLHNSQIRIIQGSSSSSSSSQSGAAAAAATADAQQPVNSLQLTVIQVADGNWHVHQGSSKPNHQQGSSSSNASATDITETHSGSDDDKPANGSRWMQLHTHSSSSSSSDSSSNSGGNSSTAEIQGRQQPSTATHGSTPAPADTPAAAVDAGQAPGSFAAIPKVALLFMATDSIPNEPVWRAFFEAAAHFQLQPAAAKAAATAAERIARSSVNDLLGDTPLHPPLRTFERSMYPTYQIQHGLAPGAEFPKPGQKRIYTFDELQVLLNERAAQKGIPLPIVLTQQLYEKYLKAALGTSAQQQQQQQQYGNGSSSSSSRTVAPAFIESALPWERQLLQQAVDRLLQLAPTVPAQQQQQQEPWDPLNQLSTTGDAAAVETEVQSALDGETTTPGSSSSSDNNHHQQQLDTTRRTLHPVLLQQQLFSVLVHTPNGVNLPEDSLFSGTELPVRLNTTRGYAQHVLAEAAMLLLKNALKDPANMKFVLVSDSSIPLYPPHVLWSQLMSEPLSRLDACITPGRSTDRYRWRPVMATKHFGFQHWRKSSQWFTLTRQAALLAVEDDHVREVFHSFCYTNLTRGAPLCVSDEHYLASLMASYGLDNTTDCQGLSHYADWSGGGWHPKSFQAHQINPGLVQQMRNGLQGRHPWDDPRHGTVTNSTVTNRTTTSVEGAGIGNAKGCDGAAAIRSASTKIFQHVSSAAAAAGGFGTTMEGGISGDERLATGTALKMSDDLAINQAAPASAGGRKLQFSRDVLQQAASSSSSKGGGGSSSSSSTEWIKYGGYVPLDSTCPLFARKFPASSVRETLAMALSCSGLGLGSWCHHD